MFLIYFFLSLLYQSNQKQIKMGSTKKLLQLKEISVEEAPSELNNSEAHIFVSGYNTCIQGLSSELFQALQALHKVVMQSDDRKIFDNGPNAEIVANSFEIIKKVSG